MASIAEIVNEFLEQKRDEIRQSYESRNIKASGRFGNSLDVSVTDSKTNITGKLTGSEYSYYVEYGRKPGKWPPRATIKQWIEDKNISLKDISIDSLAFLIARKIGQKGTPGYGIINEAFTPESLSLLGQRIGTQFLSDIKSDVIKKFR